jgi:hypothetical protein
MRNERGVWVMVDHDGHRTLYQLVEVGKGGDALRLARIHTPAVVVDMALPTLPALDEMSEGRRRSGNSRLILLNVRRTTGNDANGNVVVRQPSEPVRMATSSDSSE